MKRVIKRYSNRKLYDIQESRYVTLEDVAEMIRNGRDVSVVDADTGEDLTAMILTEILVEAARSRRASLPAAFLSQLIRYGDAWDEFAQKSLRASMGSIATSQREFERIFQEWATHTGLSVSDERQARKARKQKTRGRSTASRPRARR